MEYKLRYLDQAKDDLKQIYRYITTESGSKKIASQQVKKLRTQCVRLASLGGRLGTARPELHESLRSFPVGNYVIFFIYSDDYLDVVTIIEGHRDLDKVFN